MKIQNYLLNFGPQHPAAHGVLRLILEIKGEAIQNCDPHIGLLHRGTEKLIEHKTIVQALPYFDRLDYVSMMAQEHGYSQTVEKLFSEPLFSELLPEITVTKRSGEIRVLFLEITRILNHLLALTTHAMDVGALTPFLWAFEEREKLMEFYERVSGARMHAAYIRPGGVAFDIPQGFLLDLRKFMLSFGFRLNDIEEVLTGNRIFKERLINIGTVHTDVINDHSFTGVMSRGSGIPVDLRILHNYEIYPELHFQIPVGAVGDCYDRFLVRLQEIKESLVIMEQVCDRLLAGPLTISNYKLKNPPRHVAKNSMEALIHHFKFFSHGILMPEGTIYNPVEAPKGEFGVFLVERFTDFHRPYRCHIRSPGFYHLAGLNRIAKGLSLADVVAIIGTLDLVFGEIDR